MKPTIRLLLTSLIVVLLSQCKKEPENIVSIPDRNFLYALIKQGADTDGDHYISTAEAEAVTTLNLFYSDISDMTGIEAFINLTKLDCSYNELISLDVSKNTALESLNCYWNQLTDLDLRGNTALKILNCSYSNGYQSSLTLDLTNNILLKELYCTGNNLKTLDISKNVGIEFLVCSLNELTNLDLSNNILLKYLQLYRMPTLFKVCVWTIPFPPSGTIIDTTNIPNAYFTTDCN